MVEGMQIEGEAPKRLGRPPLRREVRETESIRSEVRPDSVREAEEYARQIQEQIGTEIFNPDEFYISQDEIPEGWSYEWKACQIVGKDNNYRMLELSRLGWRPVLAERHPYKMPANYPKTDPIMIKGQMLMELPKVLTERASKAHIRESKEALRNSEAKLYDAPPNTAPRDDPSVTRAGLNKVTRDYRNPAGQRGDE